MRPENNTLFLTGNLSEGKDFTREELTIREADQNPEIPYLRADFGETYRANTVGLSRWLQAASHLRTKPLVYCRCPFWLVAQFNVNLRFLSAKDFPAGVWVESFEIHYTSDNQEQIISRYVEIGKDIPLLDDYEGFTLEPIESDGIVFEAAFEPEKYLEFLTFLDRPKALKGVS